MSSTEPSPRDRLVLDTHVWLWASGELGGTGLLSPEVLARIEAAAGRRCLYASAASVWELAWKVARGRMRVSIELERWLRDQRRAPGIRILPIDAPLALAATRLPPWPAPGAPDGQERRDPADRFIVATARRLAATLLTRDQAILAYAAAGNVRALAV